MRQVRGCKKGVNPGWWLFFLWGTRLTSDCQALSLSSCSFSGAPSAVGFNRPYQRPFSRFSAWNQRQGQSMRKSCLTGRSAQWISDFAHLVQFLSFCLLPQAAQNSKAKQNLNSDSANFLSDISSIRIPLRLQRIVLDLTCAPFNWIQLSCILSQCTHKSRRQGKHLMRVYLKA